MAARGRQLLYRNGDGEGLLATVAGSGLPRVHPMNVGVVGDRLLVFVQNRRESRWRAAEDRRPRTGSGIAVAVDLRQFSCGRQPVSATFQGAW